jgi:hypothetical protein
VELDQRDIVSNLYSERIGTARYKNQEGKGLMGLFSQGTNA